MTARPTISSQNHLLLQVHAWRMPARYRTVLVSKQKSQVSRQAWPQPQLPRHCSQPSRPPTLLAAMAKPAANADAVRAELVQAGIPEEVIAKVIKYKPYLGWDLDTKLRPALQLWLKHLGCQQLSERLDKHHKLLLRTPEECNDVYLWLASVGIDAERIQQKAPVIMTRQLNEVQSTVQAIQQGLLLMDDQLPEFFRRHFCSLKFSLDRVASTLQVVAELLAVPTASEELQEVIKVCGERLFHQDPAAIHQRTSFFCKEFQGAKHAAKTVLKQNIYQVSVGTMRERAELKAMMSWSGEERNHALNKYPRILNIHPSTLTNNMQKLQAHNFSSAQALKMCASRPNLAGYDWSSPSNVQKLMYLMLFLQLTPAEIAVNPALLTYSLESRIGPRCEFMYRSRAIAPDMPLALSRCSGFLSAGSDANFAVRFNNPSSSPSLMYDEDFKQHWWQRWKFLAHEMGLSVADISACRALHYTSLPNTLAPRWRFLTLLEAAQAGFKAADHLKALATLSDEHFAQTFDVMNVGLVYERGSSI